MRLYDPAVRAKTGPSVYEELQVNGEHPQVPSSGSGVLGETVHSLDGTDARVIVAANGGSDLVYVPSGDPEVVHSVLSILTALDYVGGLFVDDQYCRKPSDCAGALRLSDIGLAGATHVPRPAIVVNFKHFYRKPGDLLSGVQVSDTVLQEGQGNHGGLARDQTLNNMAAMGPDFPAGVDRLPIGNIDIAPTVASILGFTLPAKGTLTGRVLDEALRARQQEPAIAPKLLRSAAAANGMSTVLEYQELKGVRYFDRACLVSAAVERCPE